MAKVTDLYNKTNRYLKRNGLEKTAMAVADSALTKTPKTYNYQTATSDEIRAQKAWSKRFSSDLKFTLVVPAYETDPGYFRAMATSVLDQTYSNWELIVVDASKGSNLQAELELVFRVGKEAKSTIIDVETTEISDKASVDTMLKYTCADYTVIYMHIKKNEGISANTNFGIEIATGDYVGVVDHDDVLTPDALYYMSKALVANEYRAKLVYSDEDKTDEKGKTFFEPNRKTNFNLDMFLTNNYICHLALIENSLIKSLKFRPAYDGAQDYDIYLRAIKAMDKPESLVLHVPKILYHWRCHPNSTAGNTDAKEYAYEAGRRAVDDYCKSLGWAVAVSHTAHLGFYHIEYKNLLFSTRPDVGIVCGPVYKLGKIAGGAMREDGSVVYRGLAKGMGGYLHRGALVQEVEASDIRNMRINPVLENLYDEMVESKLAKNAPDYVELSLNFCKKVRELGYRIIYDPDRRPE